MLYHGGTVSERHAYDADGRRVRRAHAGGTTVYAAGGLWEETLGAGGAAGSRRAVYTLQGRAVAQRDSATNAVLYLHADHLGSVGAVTDQQGQVVSRQQYDAWGAPRGGEGIGEDRTALDFTGQRRDGTGLLFYNARYYDPVVGRFLSPDSIAPDLAEPQTRNRYAYVRNNPLKYTDPTGHECQQPNPDDPGETGRCNDLADWLEGLDVHVYALHEWKADELALVKSALEDLMRAANWSPDNFKRAMGIVVVDRGGKSDYSGWQNGNKITLYDPAFVNDAWAKRTIVHEFAHRWDEASGGRLSQEMMEETGGSQAWWCTPLWCGRNNSGYKQGDADHKPSEYSSTNKWEDFAESVAAMVYINDPSVAQGFRGAPADSPRKRYVANEFCAASTSCSNYSPPGRSTLTAPTGRGRLDTTAR